MESLSEVIGGNVKRLRAERNWTQRDLANAMRSLGGTWARTTVGLLESDGVRAERLSDLAVLCAVFQVPLSELLAGDGDVQLKDKNVRTLGWLRASIAGDDHTEIASSVNGSQRGHDPDADAEIARVVRMKTGEAQAALTRWLDDDSQDLAIEATHSQWLASLSGFRDLLANVSDVGTSTTDRSAQARRGHATRTIQAILQSVSADGGSQQPPKFWSLVRSPESATELVGTDNSRVKIWKRSR